MKKPKIVASILATTVITSVFCNMTSFAFDTSYRSATDLNSSIEEYMYDSSQVDWYKFTVTENEIPAPYTVTLVVPNNCMYNFDLRYRSLNSTERPSVFSNETYVGSNRRRRMSGVLTQAGEYFVRVYSQNGSYDQAYPYRIMKSYHKDLMYNLVMPTDGLPQSSSTDWAICADVVGTYVYNNNIKYYSSGRNYKKAYTFVNTNYTSEAESGYGTAKKATPEETAVAVNYIYSGDLMINPKFKAETNKIYEIEDLARYVWEYDEPMIFYLKNMQYDIYKTYIILDGINIGENTLKYYDVEAGDYAFVDYDDFLLDGLIKAGLPIEYTGTNIVTSDYKRIAQPVYN